MVDSVFGLTFTKAKEAELAEAIVDCPVPPGDGPRVVATANLDHIANLTRNLTFRDAYRRAWAVTADGMPVYLYAKLRGLPLPARVTGSDLCRRILEGVSRARHRLFFVVGSTETGEAIRSRLMRSGFLSRDLGFRVPPFGFDRDDDYSRGLVDEIAHHGTTHLFLGVGSPKSEIWSDRARTRLGDCYVLNFGAGLDYFGGTKTRAPKILQVTGLEWAWRLACEPRRLFRRYFVNSWRFLSAVRLDLSRRSA